MPLYTYKILWMMSPSPLKSLNIPFSDSHHFTYFPSSVAQVHPLKQFFNVVETSNPSSLHTLSISLHPLPPSSSFLFLSSINVMVHHYYWSLAKALNSLAALFPRYMTGKSSSLIKPNHPLLLNTGEKYSQGEVNLFNFKFLIANFKWVQTQSRKFLIFFLLLVGQNIMCCCFDLEKKKKDYLFSVTDVMSPYQVSRN